MPRKNKDEYNKYMREYRQKKRQSSKPKSVPTDTSMPSDTRFSQPQKPVEPTQLMGNPQPVKQESIVEPNMPSTAKSETSENVEVMRTKSDFRTKRKILIKFVRFDQFKPSNRDECLKVRLSRLGLFYEDTDKFNEHLELCEGCSDWWYNLDLNTLNSKDGEHVYLAYADNFESPEELEETIKKLNGKIITIDRRLKKVTLIGNELSSPLENIDLGKCQLFGEEKPKKEPLDVDKVNEDVIREAFRRD